jgi:hypothetical protein
MNADERPDGRGSVVRERQQQASKLSAVSRVQFPHSFSVSLRQFIREIRGFAE